MGRITFILILLLPYSFLMAKGVYQQTDSFIEERLGSSEVESKVIWLTSERQLKIKKILGHKYSKLRVRYWQKKSELVWVLEEIGKEEPITVGIHIKDTQINNLKVLVYRETRGDEVRHSFFTKQFSKIKLNSKNKLDKPIDGITGATLSVRALKKLSIMALWLSSEVLAIKE